jgi:hypothetical protein
LLLHDQVTTSDQHQQQQQSDLQSELELLSLSAQSRVLDETGDGVMTLDGLPLPSAGRVGSAGDVAARFVALLEGLNIKAADSACCSTAAAAPAAEMLEKHPSDIFSGVASFSVSINSHSSSRSSSTHSSSSSSSSMQLSDQPGNAAEAITGDLLHRKPFCYQMAWHDVALGLPESAPDATAVVVGCAPMKQQQQQRCNEASVQACLSSFCPSVVATVSNQELQLLLLALDCQEQAARSKEESSNNSGSSDVQRNSCMGLGELPATSTLAGLCQLSDACASAAPAAAPAAAGLMLLLDWGPADW